MLEKEWKDVPGYDGLYRVSNYGEVYSVRMGRNLSTNAPKYGYLVANLRGADGKHKVATVHRLVALLFIPNPEGMEIVNHKDGNKHNNRVDNLEWCTQRDNVKHFYDMKVGIGKDGDLDPNIIRQFPKKWRPAIRSCYRGLDGYWIHLNDGWEASDIGPGCKVIHEHYFADLWPHIYGLRKTE